VPVRGKTAGNANRGSGWLTQARRLRIYARDNFQCYWCRNRLLPLTLDHIFPRSHGGTNDTFNLVTACMQCNRNRGDKPRYFTVDQPLPTLYEAVRAARLLGLPIHAKVRRDAQRQGIVI
jgi:5-methylcytosine-specific restriction endonuclease McrA